MPNEYRVRVVIEMRGKSEPNYRGKRSYSRWVKTGVTTSGPISEMFTGPVHDLFNECAELVAASRTAADETARQEVRDSWGEGY